MDQMVCSRLPAEVDESRSLIPREPGDTNLISHFHSIDVLLRTVIFAINLGFIRPSALSPLILQLVHQKCGTPDCCIDSIQITLLLASGVD
jgi:hypothetical protein